MSTFLAVPDQVDNFLKGFKKQFAIMRRQPGLISAQLHRGIAGSSLFMNYIVWETVDDFERGYELPEFQAQLKQYPPGTVVSASFFRGSPYRACASERERQRCDDQGLPLSINFNPVTLDLGSNDAARYRIYADLAEHLRYLRASLHHTNSRLAILGVRDPRRH
jgi:heme-degrading monooxygenase HmoA